MRHLLLITVIAISIGLQAQPPGKIIRFTSHNTSFPDTGRAKGYDYGGKHYDAATSYSDSSVLIFVPKDFSPGKKINFVYWFHGWGNSIDSCIKNYTVLEQFSSSGRNAIFVFPEAAKFAPDGYGGKLQSPEVFRALMQDVIAQLKQNNLVKRFDGRLENCDITLAGHSGAYRVISNIINKTPVNEVILFDAFYGANDSFLQWLSDPNHRFINIYTKTGGTFDNSHLIMAKMGDSLRVPYVSVAEDAVNENLLKTHKKIFIYSNSSHAGVLTVNSNWERFLRYY